MVTYVPDRGEIVWLDFEPQTGKEINKKRPALVISPMSYNKKTGLALFMPITSQVKGYPFEVAIVAKSIKGVILTDQVRSLDWKARNAKKITTLGSDIIQDALKKFQLLIQ